jgi:pimeloyl-ACP methyl ester carboxylesterase
MDSLNYRRSGGAIMISDKVGMRELITLGGGGVLLHGTYHRAAGVAASDPGGTANKLGVMFLNALSSPRSLIGDSGIYWATHFAEIGYPCFRFDLPGLGDSYGEIPNDLLRFTNEGGYAAIASSKTKELVGSRKLTGVVMFGHCAGATTAIYAASACSNECKGLILMDPYFNLPKAITSSIRPELVNWARRSRVGAILRASYDRVREFRGGMRKDALPANANYNLISRFKQVLSRGLPILVLRAHQPSVLGNSTGKAGNFDYLHYMLSFAQARDQVTIKMIEGTDHSFANRSGRDAVRGYAEAWMAERFSQPPKTPPTFEDQDLRVNGRESLVLRNSLAAQACEPGAVG